MSGRWIVIALCFPCPVALPILVYDIHRGLDEMLRGLDGPGLSEFWIGIFGTLAGVVAVEYGCRFSSEMWEEELRRRPPGKPAPKGNPLAVLQGCWLGLIHGLAILAFAATLDGGVRWAATRWVYLVYAVPASLVLSLRWERWTWPERLFLRWGWVPVLAFGVPIALPKLLAAGLIVDPWN